MMLAKKYGYIVTVDWQNYKTPYNEETPINGTLNSWEYFFEQPSGLQDIYDNCATPYISEDKYPYKVVPHYGTSNIAKEGVPKKGQIEKINRFIAKNCPLKLEVRMRFDDLAKELDLSSALGVHIRGTDMNATVGHNKPAPFEMIVETIRKTLIQTGLKRIFLCTDEEKIKAKMQELFGDQVFFVDAFRSMGGQEGIHLQSNVENMRENHRYLLGMEVLRDAYLLSRCQAFVCGKSNVAYAAIVMNNNQFTKIEYTN